MGLRHRASLGVTEETDAVAVVVSEETGLISVARNGRMVRGLDAKRLLQDLQETFPPSRPPSLSGLCSGTCAIGWGTRWAIRTHSVSDVRRDVFAEMGG